MHNDESLRNRLSPLAMSSEEFRKLGTQLIDRIAGFLDSLPERPVTPAESPVDIRQALAAQRTLPRQGTDPAQLLHHAADLLFDHSLFNGALLGIHHLVGCAHWRTGRTACRRGQSQRRGMAALTHGERNRSADGSLDR
jgi:hypothetical protein